MYEYEQYIAMQDIKEMRVERKDPNANMRICFKVRATALRLRLHTEGFSLYPHRTFHKGTSTEELQQYEREYTTPPLKHKPLHKRWALSQAQSKRKYNLVITKIANNLLVI